MSKGLAGIFILLFLLAAAAAVTFGIWWFNCTNELKKCKADYAAKVSDYDDIDQNLTDCNIDRGSLEQYKEKYNLLFDFYGIERGTPHNRIYLGCRTYGDLFMHLDSDKKMKVNRGFGAAMYLVSADNDTKYPLTNTDILLYFETATNGYVRYTDASTETNGTTTAETTTIMNTFSSNAVHIHFAQTGTSTEVASIFQLRPILYDEDTKGIKRVPASGTSFEAMLDTENKHRILEHGNYALYNKKLDKYIGCTNDQFFSVPKNVTLTTSATEDYLRLFWTPVFSKYTSRYIQFDPKVFASRDDDEDDE